MIQQRALPNRTKGVRTYLYLNGERVAVNNLYNTNHGQYYYGSDLLGSVKFITGQAGQEVRRIEYDVFGGIYKGASPYGLETGYTGKPYDSVTGLSDYGFRDYSPAHARFITEDPIRDGENWFAYVGNNPVNWIDPWGLSASDGKNKVQKRSATIQECNFLNATLGEFAGDILSTTTISRVPFNMGRSASVIWKTIYIADDYFVNPLRNADGAEILAHETWHQVQYIANRAGAGLIPLPKLYPSAWDRLAIDERLIEQMGVDVYNSGDYEKTDISRYNSLNDIYYLESQAQLVGKYAKLYYKAKNNLALTSTEKNALIEMNRILINSGINSEATRWDLKDLY